jgi:hypothetical protein
MWANLVLGASVFVAMLALLDLFLSETAKRALFKQGHTGMEFG